MAWQQREGRHSTARASRPQAIARRVRAHTEELPLPTEAARESRLRRQASRDGLYAYKARAFPYTGLWFITNPSYNLLVSSEYGMTLEQAESWLADD
jgi:hypothetical protein